MPNTFESQTPSNELREEMQNALTSVISTTIKDEIAQFNPQSLFDVFGSDIDLLMKRYHLERSYLTQIAHWYGDLSFWRKTLFIGNIACCVLLGTILFNLVGIITTAALITINLLALAICVGLIKLINNHLDVEQRCCDQMCNGVKQLEDNLKNSIQTFIDIQAKLTKLLNVTKKRNEELSNYVDILETEAKTLRLESEKFKETISELQNTLLEFKEKNQIVNKKGTLIEEKLDELQTIIEQDINYVSTEDEQLLSTRNDLKDCSSFLESFDQTLLKMQQSQKEQSQFIKNTHKTLKKENQQNNKKIQALEEKLQFDTLSINQQYEESIKMEQQAEEELNEILRLCEMEVKPPNL